MHSAISFHCLDHLCVATLKRSTFKLPNCAQRCSFNAALVANTCNADAVKRMIVPPAVLQARCKKWQALMPVPLPRRADVLHIGNRMTGEVTVAAERRKRRRHRRRLYVKAILEHMLEWDSETKLRISLSSEKMSRRAIKSSQEAREYTRYDK